MLLPKDLITKLTQKLEADQLLTPDLASNVASSLEKGAPINWNILLSSQLKAEEGDTDEA
jgi:hypothetical protein